MFKDLANFFYEVGNMKRLKHMGTYYAGVENPDSLAEHVMRTAQIGYVLATLEKADVLTVLEICLFHDNGEVRIGDHTRISDVYLNGHEAERAAFEDQIKGLGNAGEGIKNIVRNYNNPVKDNNYTVARDADLLETIFQAKEYLDLGYPTQRWLKNGKKYLKTKSAKKLFDSLMKTHFTDWWNNLNIA